MDSSIVVATISGFTAIVATISTNYLLRRRELDNDWRKQRLEHYKEFMATLSDSVGGNSSFEARKRFSHASNNIFLIGSPGVLKTLRAYLDETAKTLDEQTNNDGLLSLPVFAIRDDLGLKNSNRFQKEYLFHMWAPRKKDT